MITILCKYRLRMLDSLRWMLQLLANIMMIINYDNHDQQAVSNVPAGRMVKTQGCNCFPRVLKPKQRREP